MIRLLTREGATATANQRGQRRGDASNKDPLDLLIVGAGFAGMYMLIKARLMGLRALAIDAAPSVGGTWYHNRYPGARVDIQSLEYSYSFDEALQQQWHWTERYASQPELLRYANHVADRFALRNDIRLDTRLTNATWDEASEAVRDMDIAAADKALERPRCPCGRVVSKRAPGPRRDSSPRHATPPGQYGLEF